MTLTWRVVAAGALLAGGAFVCGMNAGGTASDHSGTYYVAIGHRPRFTMEIVQTGTVVEFAVTGKDLDLHGGGTIDGTVMTLTADLGEAGNFSALATFSEETNSFAGSWGVAGPTPVQGTITGTRTPWPTYDLDALGVPKLVVAGSIDLLRIGRVSKFRSGEGHDYSDDFESCRSMKHYFDPKPGIRRSSIRLFSPVAGTIIGTTDEWETPSLWKGQVVGIRPDGWPAFDVVIFHLDPRRPLAVGSSVSAGEELGTSEKVSGTAADVAVGVHTPDGYRLVSLFEAMTEAVFRRYRECGAGARSDFIVQRAERDGDPLSCVGEQFVDRGSLENWVDLLDDPVPRRPRPYRPSPR